MAHRLNLRPFGASFVVHGDDERFAEAARFGLGRYPTVGLQERVSVTLQCRPLPAGAAIEWPRTKVVEDADGLTLRSGRSVLDVRRTATSAEAELALEPELLDDPHATRVFVEAAFWSAMIGPGHLHAVHSGLVVRRATGLLLRGQSGAGKSTLTYACLRRGMSVVSDDWVYAVADAGRTVLHGYPWLMWMTRDAALRFPELTSILPVPHPGSDRVKVPVRPPQQRRRVSIEPAAVVFVEPSTDVSVRRISPRESADRFAVSALDSERGGLPAPFVDRLLDRPAFVLGRGASPDEAAAALDQLAAGLATSLR